MVFLKDFSELFTLEKLEILKKNQIIKSLDFLQCHNDKIRAYLGVNLSEVIKMKEKILLSNNCKPIRADKLCDFVIKRTTSLETGIAT